MLCRKISVIIWFLWWGWTERLSFSTLQYFVNAEETCIYSVQQAFVLFPEFVWWAELTNSSLQPLPSPCLTLSLQQYKNTNPAPFHSAPRFLGRGLLQTCRAIPFPEAVKSEFQTVALAGGHFCTLLLLLERAWRDRIKATRWILYFSSSFPTLLLKEGGKIPNKAAVSGKRRGLWEQVEEGCLVLVKRTGILEIW